METRKLYYEDEYMSSFDGVVQTCTAAKDGWEVVLDQTAFYPEGGGQPSDRGTLNGVAVLDVQERDGFVVHSTAQALEPGTAVHGEIDMERRLDYMQQHSADHILTGVIHNHYGFDNVGFHMGQESTFIDLDGVVEDEDLLKMEQLANEAIWKNLPITAAWPDAEALARMTYRSKKELTGAVRIVTIPGVDVCACCGTHMHTTGEVLAIKIISTKRMRGGVRIEYVAGRRAFAYLSAIQAQNRKIYTLLSAKPLHTAEAVERLLEERDSIQARVASMEKEHCAALAEQKRGAGNVVYFEDGLSADSVRRLADAIKDTCGGVAAVFSGTDAGGYKYALAVAEGDIRAEVKAMNAALQGRGGGRDANFVQGSVKAVRAEIEAYFAK